MEAQYVFSKPHNVIFITGAALSGKTTLAPMITKNIDNCVVQHMDIVRLLSQDVERRKPKKEQTEFVFYGSADSYELVGDGSYSKENLIKGFRIYSQKVSEMLFNIFPKLNPEDVENIIFEGVQLMPELVAPFLDKPGYKLIVLTTTEKQFEINREKTFKDHPAGNLYTNEILMTIQGEIVRQAKKITSPQVHIIEPKASLNEAVADALGFLIKSDTITQV
jgi:2-phosphoglycerate kinase